MPFLQILWRRERLDQGSILRTRDDLASAVGAALTAADPDHLVTAAMVDSRLEEIGPLDRIRSDVFVTVFARHEPARDAGASTITHQLASVARAASGLENVVVELVLTAHSSSFDYTSLE